MEERRAAEEEELEEFRMLEQAAADKSINSLIGMLKFTNLARKCGDVVCHVTWCGVFRNVVCDVTSRGVVCFVTFCRPSKLKV